MCHPERSRRAEERALRASRRTLLCLSAAILLFIAAVSGPIDRRADTSFGWHMVQHLVILYGVALLLLLARPFDLFARLAVKSATASLVRAIRPLHVVALPPVALVIFIAMLWGTHFSPLYELALENGSVHAIEHLLYLIAGLIFWLPVIAPPPLRPQGYPVRLFYLAVALPQGALVGMALTSAREPLYPHYLAAAGSHAAAMADQGNAAAVMWVAGGLVIFSAMLLTLALWAHREGNGSRLPTQVAP